MKYLVIGIDGIDNNLQKNYLPYQNLRYGTAECDKYFISRGWADFIFSSTAINTKAFYEYPSLDNTYKYNTYYNTESTEKFFETIWKKINKKGFKVGVMNIPTVNFKTKVNGFFIPGSGGGIDNQETNQEYIISEILKKNNYIVDLRLKHLKKYSHSNLNEIFKMLDQMTKARVKTYIDLNKIYNVDFGFIVFRSAVIVENLFRALYSHQEIKIEVDKFYKNFYEHINHLIKTINPENKIFISDHGTNSYKYSININKILETNGYLFHKKIQIKKFQKIKSLIPGFLKNILKKNIEIQKITYFLQNRTIAFNITYHNNACIFINDNKRFNGPIRYRNINKIAKEVCTILNNSKIFKDLGIKATLSKKEGLYPDLVPDILVDLPDEIHNNNSQNEDMIYVISPSKIPKVFDNDFYYTKKSRNILFAYDSKNEIKLKKCQNLSCIHNKILEEFDNVV